ncbi:hypothetical protein MNQ95_04465 [Pseudoxanthomonas daejeonensis]|uniref:HMA domain-containing protein n=1 Tax=Pseudoxanthomonas daejeonensis TaxID=266062 RepID=A0ABQ6Z3M1_9GAMM|nr:hypothetical protein [Pseudoxanthomonas daejeonensis]KAF1692092.1 hypothetical protein CSC65_15245 [Pseudoxanthomonas daejeonensis]UNK58360.1 hypothetical protein MNQ95_04465 [Pseudoxanthomonas daejeonensis]
MELDIILRTGPVDVGHIERLLLEADPAGVVDLDAASGHLRISTCAARDEVAAILAAAGHPVEVPDIVIVPSVCCGGCSG